MEKCTVCNDDSDEFFSIAEKYVLEVIKSEHPEWVENNGICRKCVEYYKALDNAIKLET